MSKPVNTDTIQQGKQYLRDNFRKGAKCPCCDQLVRLWKYTIHSTMGRLLIELYRLDGEYHHINTLWERTGNKSMGGDFSKLIHWGLIEPMPKDPDENKRATGYWKITDLGVKFVLNQTAVPKVLLMFDKRKYGHEGLTRITDVLSKKFDYNELIQSTL